MLILALSSFKEAVARLPRDVRGVVAVEFALVVFVLILLLIGVCDVVPTWLAYTHTGTAASTAADTTGRFTQMQTSDMVNVYTATADVMSPFSAAAQSLRITNVFSDGNGHAKVYWSCGSGTLPPYAALSLVTSTPTGANYQSFLFLYNVFVGIWLNGTNTSYVVTEVSYSYSAPAHFVLTSPQTLSSVAYYLPRASAYVGFPWNGGTTLPPAPASTTQTSSVSLSNGATCNYAS